MSKRFDSTRLARLLVLVSPCLGGCPTPGQYGGPIPIDSAGLVLRLQSLCQAGTAAKAGVYCAPTSELDRDEEGAADRNEER